MHKYEVKQVKNFRRFIIRWSFWLEINLSALRANLKKLKSLVKPGVNFLPVIKSEAYGHGLLPVARTLASEGIYGFGLSDLEEALRIREAGLALPIILLSGFEAPWLPEIIRLKIIPAVIDLHQLNLLASFSRKTQKKVPFHLMIDTGMGRCGILPEEIDKALAIIEENPQLRLEGIMSHLACGEKPDKEITLEQKKTFAECIKRIKRTGANPRFFHLANSAALMLDKDTHYNLVRPGLALYGAYPCDPQIFPVKLEPVMTVKAQVLSVKKIKAGKGIGYGPIFIAPQDMKIALVPVGYAEGYLRSLSNRGFAWIKGKRVPLVGAVSMRLIIFDVTGIDVSPGDEIILLGEANKAVPAEELASRAGTIPYELFCLLGRGNFKIYLD
ncbi:alanine racemase [Thermodesulfatator indicus]